MRTPLLLAALLAAALASASAAAAVIDFEDLDGSSDQPIDTQRPGGYVGLTWNGVGVVDVIDNFGPDNQASFPGWYNGSNCTPSSPKCSAAYNFGRERQVKIAGAVDGQTFDLIGFNLTSSVGQQDVLITGMSSSGLEFSKLLSLSADEGFPATFRQLDWGGLSGFTITVSGQPEAPWVLDNVTLSPVPEPSTLALFAAGGLGLLVTLRRRRG
jgi:opacity protein-like surface antigen